MPKSRELEGARGQSEAAVPRVRETLAAALAKAELLASVEDAFEALIRFGGL